MYVRTLNLPADPFFSIYCYDRSICYARDYVQFEQILKILQKPDIKKYSGMDRIPSIVVKNCAFEVAPILPRLYQSSYNFPKLLDNRFGSASAE